jgi:hypothetical protein
MKYRKYCTVSGLLFSLVALAHLLRLIYDMSVQIEGFAVPMIASWIGFVIPACLAFWAFRIVRASRNTW